jgi:hypothetical protein
VHGNDFATRIPVAALNLPPRLTHKGFFPVLELVGTYRPAGETVAFDRAGHLVPGFDPDGLLAVVKAELARLGLSLGDWARRQPLDDVIDHAPVFYAVHLWNLYQESLSREAA